MKTIDSRISRRAKGLAPSAIRELLPYSRMEDMVSLGGGYPNPATFAINRLTCETIDGVSLSLEGGALARGLQYGPSAGEPVLIEFLREWQRERDGIDLEQDRFVVLNGGQEGLFAVGYLFLDEEDSVLCSEPTYPGALSSFRAFTGNFVTSPVDGNGIRTDMISSTLENLAARGSRLPKFVYTIPTGHNPAGVNLSLERRRELLEVARRFDLLVVEDDPYRMITYDGGEPLPTLQSMDTDGRVIRLDSFSKIFLPGFRIGYLTAPVDIASKVVLFKQASNLHTTSLNQVVLAEYFSRKGVSPFLARTREIADFYRRNRDALIDACREFLPGWVEYDVPEAGMFVWFRLPERINAGDLVKKEILNDRVVLVPGPAFSPGGGSRNCVRASFGTADHATLAEGAARFAGMLQKVE